MGGLFGVGVRGRVHALHERVRARGAAQLAPGGAPRSAARRPRRVERRGARVPAMALRPPDRPAVADDRPPFGAAALHPGVREVEPRPLGYRLSRTAVEHTRWRPAGHARTRRTPARRHRGEHRNCRRGLARASSCSRPPRSARDRSRRVCPGRGGDRERDRFQPVRHALPGGVLARVRAVSRRVPRRRRAASGRRCRRAGDRRIRAGRHQDARSRLPASGLRRGCCLRQPDRSRARRRGRWSERRSRGRADDAWTSGSQGTAESSRLDAPRFATTRSRSSQRRRRPWTWSAGQLLLRRAGGCSSCWRQMVR